MKKEEYTQAQQLLLFCATAISEYPYDLDEFIRAIEKSDTLGPVMDPTLWQKGHKKMDQIKIIAKAIRRANNEIIPAIEKLNNLSKEQSE